MKYLFMAALLSFLALVVCATQENKAALLPTYELYSWQDGHGNWCFAMLYTTSRQKSVEEIFDKKVVIRGLDKLKQRISRLDRPSRIIWADKLIFNGAIVKGSERLEWPPRNVIEEVKNYAAGRHVEIIGTE